MPGTNAQKSPHPCFFLFLFYIPFFKIVFALVVTLEAVMVTTEHQSYGCLLLYLDSGLLAAQWCYQDGWICL